MRKDVRFGLIIAGTLLAVFIVWAALFTRVGADKSAPVALEPTAPPTDVTSTPPPTVTSSPDVDNRSTMVSDTGAATQPSDSHDWTALLATGGSATTQPSSVWSSAPVDSAPLMSNTGATTRPSIASGGTHKVQSGETFSTIAAAVYGDSRDYTRLEDANPTINPTRLRVGMLINVPDLNAPLTVKTVAYEAKPTDVRADVDSSKSYRVRASDTLMGIARRLYGDGQAWQKIYDVNRDAIGPNPARLTVGMVLRLPNPPTVASIN
jgi:nucleoid-associated protein YgaU